MKTISMEEAVERCVKEGFNVQFHWAGNAPRVTISAVVYGFLAEEATLQSAVSEAIDLVEWRRAAAMLNVPVISPQDRATMIEKLKAQIEALKSIPSPADLCPLPLTAIDPEVEEWLRGRGR
jgi:hypothetical protein